MKVLVFFLLFSTIIACQLKDQATEMQALKDCTYELLGADSVFLAGNDITGLLASRSLNLATMPGLGLAFMSQELPLSGTLNIRVTNPGTQQAGINGFEYKVYIKDTELAEGVVDQRILVEPRGGTFLLRVKIDENVFPLITEPANQKAVSEFFNTADEKTATITFKIKPAITIGEKKISYPGYIDINKEVTNKQLLSFLNSGT